MSNLTVLSICSGGLLNFLTLLASSFWASSFGCGCCCCCRFACFSYSLGRGGAFHFGDFFHASAGSPLALPDLPGPPGCFFPATSLLNGIVGHLKSVAQPVCDALMPVICSYRRSRCMWPSFWFGLWRWG